MLIPNFPGVASAARSDSYINDLEEFLREQLVIPPKTWSDFNKNQAKLYKDYNDGLMTSELLQFYLEQMNAMFDEEEANRLQKESYPSKSSSNTMPTLQQQAENKRRNEELQRQLQQAEEEERRRREAEAAAEAQRQEAASREEQERQQQQAEERRCQEAAAREEQERRQEAAAREEKERRRQEAVAREEQERRQEAAAREEKERRRQEAVAREEQERRRRQGAAAREEEERHRQEAATREASILPPVPEDISVPQVDGDSHMNQLIDDMAASFAETLSEGQKMGLVAVEPKAKTPGSLLDKRNFEESTKTDIGMRNRLQAMQRKQRRAKRPQAGLKPPPIESLKPAPTQSLQPASDSPSRPITRSQGTSS
jgi:hypothetical protein